MKSLLKYFFLFLFLGIFQNVSSQKKNDLLDRSFWKGQPTISEIEQKIKEGHSATEMTQFNFDATVYALLENNSLETIKFLLSQGNSIDKITHDGRSYLMWAAYKGNLEVMKYLVAEGSKLDIIDQHGYSLFMFPASTGQTNLEMYDYMISDLDVKIQEEKDRYGRNALIACASRIQDFTLVDYFISKGLDINSVDKKGNGMFHYAAQTGNEEVMKKLAEDYKVNTAVNEKTNENAILFASRRFSRSGAETPLSFYQFLEKEFDLDPTIVANDGNTVLHNLATRTKNLDLLKYFVEKGVDPNILDEKNNNTLILAASRANHEIIDYLISKTADVNIKNKEGMSGLTRATRSNSIDVMKLLVENGANIDVLDRSGNNLGFHLVDSYSDGEVFEEKAEYLVSQGLDIKATQNGNTTLLHHAIKKNDVDLLKVLLSYGIEINAKDENGETALHKAALQSQDEKMLMYLVEAGAETEITTAFDESAYDLAKNNEMLADKDLAFLKEESE